MFLEFYIIIGDSEGIQIEAGFFLYYRRFFGELHVDTKCVVESIP